MSSPPISKTSSLQQQASQLEHDMVELYSISFMSFPAFIFVKIIVPVFKCPATGIKGFALDEFHFIYATETTWSVANGRSLE